MAGAASGRRAGLLVVDMTRALADPSLASHEPAGPPAVRCMRPVLDKARRAQAPIWFSRGGKRWHTSTASPLSAVERGGWLRVGGWHEETEDQAAHAMEIVPDLAPGPGEVVLTKSKPSAFFATPLASQVIGAGVGTLVVVGMMTSGCVRATVTDAFSYDLEVLLPEGCLADRDAGAHEANLRDMGRKYARRCGFDEVAAAFAETAAAAERAR